MKQYSNDSNFYKSFKHITFTLFWFLISALVFILILRLNQWNNEQITTCMDRGYEYYQCILVK